MWVQFSSGVLVWNIYFGQVANTLMKEISRLQEWPEKVG